VQRPRRAQFPQQVVLLAAGLGEEKPQYRVVDR
jgi:hypothetical protein